MSIFENHAGFNITGAKLQVVEVNYKNDELYIENVDEEYYPEFLDFSSKETKIISILQEAFNELNFRKQLNANYISFSLPQEFFRITEIPYDSSLISEDLKNHFKWEISTQFPSDVLQDYIIQYIPIEFVGTESIKKAIVIGAVKNYLKVLHKFCLRNNLNLKLVDNAHIASNSSLLLDKSLQKDQNLISIYLRDNNFSIIIQKGKTPLHFFTKKIGAYSELIPALESENERLKELGINLNSESSVYLSGDKISENLLNRLERNFNIEVKRFNPFLSLNVKEELKDNEFITKNFNSFSAACGISLRLV